MLKYWRVPVLQVVTVAVEGPVDQSLPFLRPLSCRPTGVVPGAVSTLEDLVEPLRWEVLSFLALAHVGAVLLPVELEFLAWVCRR